MLRAHRQPDLESAPPHTHYPSAAQRDAQAKALLAQQPAPQLQQLLTLHLQANSIQAEVLAEALQTGCNCLRHDNYLQIGRELLSLHQLPHDQAQLRQLLRSSHKLEPMLLLAVLWELRETTQAAELASTLLDAYTLPLVLGGGELARQWKQFAGTRLRHLQLHRQIRESLEKEAQGRAGQEKDKSHKSRPQGFRKVVVPL